MTPYALGQHAAVKTAQISPALRETLLKALSGPRGELYMRMPVQATTGALAGAAAGQLHSDNPGRGALLGALSGTLGGAAVASAPRLRKALIKKLRG